MKVGGVAMRTIRALPARDGVEVIDQRALPHRLLSARLIRRRRCSPRSARCGCAARR